MSAQPLSWIESIWAAQYIWPMPLSCDFSKVRCRICGGLAVPRVAAVWDFHQYLTVPAVGWSWATVRRRSIGRLLQSPSDSPDQPSLSRLLCVTVRDVAASWWNYGLLRYLHKDRRYCGYYVAKQGNCVRSLLFVICWRVWGRGQWVETQSNRMQLYKHTELIRLMLMTTIVGLHWSLANAINSVWASRYWH